MTVETLRSRKEAPKGARALSLRLLGEIRLQREGLTLALPASKRTRALLGYLVATGVPQSRQTLCDLLWDGPDDPRAALRWSLTKLRPLLDEPAAERLDADRERVAFRPEGAWIDIRRLESMSAAVPASLALSDLEEAAECLGGEFLDGLDLPSCYRFHHWCVAERERWGALRRKVLSHLIERLSDEPEKALSHARAMVSADPLSEAAHGRLVTLLSALGRRGDARDHYAYARDLLRREMGAPLVGDLKAPPPLRREITPEAGDEPAPLAPRAPMQLDSGLVGRAHEREAIRAAIDGLIAGMRPNGLLFLGEPGIGKSRLLGELVREGELRHVRIVSARCFEAEAVRPYGCWADALGGLIDEIDDPGKRRDLSAFKPTGAADGADDNGRQRLFGAVQALLRDLATTGPLVVMIDDLQWIDEGSASLLHFLHRGPEIAGRFLFAGAARADEIEENPWCKKLVGALVQEGRVQRLTLAPFGASDTAQLLGVAEASPVVVDAMRESGGNPLFLTEIARSAPHGRSTAGQNLFELIRDRVARLDVAERGLIVFASATTRAFRPEMLGAAMNLPEAQLIERLDRLERRGLLKPGADGRFDFAHDLFRQATYQSLSQPRRQLIHRQIARALDAAVAGDKGLAGELAYHAGAAGDHRQAVASYIVLGELCLRMFANSAAIDAADRGLGHLAHWPVGPERVGRQIALLSVKVFAGANPGARSMPQLLVDLHRAVEEAELLDLRTDAAQGWHLISWTTQHLNDTGRSHEAILRAEEITRTADDLTRLQHLSNAGRCMLEGEAENVTKARSFLQEADVLAARLQQTLVELEWGKGLLALWDGDLVEAHSRMRRSLALARLREDRWREMECLVRLAKMAVQRGSFDDVAGRCDEIDAVASKIGDGRAPVADALRALAVFVRDHEREPEFLAAVAGLRAFDDKSQLAFVLNEGAAIELDRGAAADGLAMAQEALEAAGAVKLCTEILVATALLARARATMDDRRGAEASLATPIEGSGPEPFSARARAHLKRAREALTDSNADSNATVRR